MPTARLINRKNSVLGTHSAVKAVVGIAPLPATLGDAEETLVQILPPVEELTRGWRLLKHANLRKTPRLATFVDHLLDDIPAL